MTIRTLTEIRDLDDDTWTQIVVGPSSRDVCCAEVRFDQWATGDRENGTERTVHLELGEAIALRDALTACIEAMTGEEGEP